MTIHIRQETEKDYLVSAQVVEEAFEHAAFSDHTEHNLVANLRKSDVFVPQLSLVAEDEGVIVGHIMLTKLMIRDGEKQHESLALAPVSVVPGHQKKGVGSALIRKSLEIARDLNFRSVIVLGHDTYYPRFGFKPAHTWGIKAPFDVSKEAFMALELVNGSLDQVKGTVMYPKVFYE
ncbi:GNAT family N-acetyltransferase [Methanosphaerula palustris]|uniref:GCN5-related N-acetyltransferase n=1 Tax=Methanosphaerula palustris (strain ATCC BAA-1556 / DSM 19958 / E1-9c) TaxID=521011 RepID=B8GEY7_METPE|nr:N-acetyltransferase [Methanosphaerula palustris]ACL17793.1 GCN5-related N-acetyltransferase [Methanosphaerula palustris E1-9c]